MNGSGNRNETLKAKGFNSDRKTLPEKTDVGDFFAPFFDVVFYKPMQPTGIQYDDDLIQAAVDEGSIGRGADELQGSRTIGGSALRLRTSGGGAQLFFEDSSVKDIRNFGANLTIDVRAAAAYRATLVLQPPYEDALSLVDSTAIKFGSIMEIQWGYMGRGGEPILSDKGLFSIIQPSVTFGQQVTIKISGWDFLSSSGGSIDRKCAWPRESYKTDECIVRDLLTKINGDLRADIQVKGTSPLVKVKTGQHVVQSSTDIRFFQHLLHQNDCTYTLDGNTVRIRDQSALDVAKPSYTLMWYKQPTEKTDIPMISFESNSIPSLFAAQGSRGYFTISHNRDDDECDEKVKKPEDVTAGMPGCASGADATEAGHEKIKSDTSSAAASPYKDVSEDICASGKVFVVPDRRPNKEEEKENKARNILRMANTRANVTIPGHPVVLPMMIVNVVGVGEKFGGTYRILKLSHEIGTGGYITKLDLLRASTTGKKTDADPATRATRNRDCGVDQQSGAEVIPQTVDESGENTDSCSVGVQPSAG